MDRMTSMATFVKVVESGGFSAAARTLSMSPSMVTAHVQALEERLGVRLLNRSTRRVSLTEVGHAYYERCLQILAEADDADQIAQALQSTPRGTLRLNTSIAIPPLLAPVIAEFVALYPEVSVNLTMTDRMIDLVEEGFDLAVRNMAVPDSSLVVRRVATYRFVVCGAGWRAIGRGRGKFASQQRQRAAVGGGARPGTRAGPELPAYRGDQIGSPRSDLDRVLADRARHQRDLPASPPSLGEGPQLH